MERRITESNEAMKDVYGSVRGQEGQRANNLKYVAQIGHPTDEETGLIYMRARYYDPEIGRFVSEDPRQHGVNWYRYADGNPTNAIDLTGKEATIIELGQGMTIFEFMQMIAIRFGVIIQSVHFAQRGPVPAQGSRLWNWLVQMGEDPTMWRYLMGEIQGPGSGVLKAWVRYHAQLVWAYIEADAGDLFRHAMPYIGN